MDEQKGLDELPNRVLGGFTPGNPRMLDSAGVECEKVLVESDHDAFTRCGKLQLVRIAPTTTAGFLGCEDIDSSPA